MANWLTKVWRRFAGQPGPLNDFWYKSLGGFGPTQSGVIVDPDSALRVAAVYACARVLAETLASLPLFLFVRDGEERRKDRTHPLYSLLHDAPNPWQTSFEFREMMMLHVVLRGNAIAMKVRRPRAKIELWPIHPDRIRIKQGGDGRLVYEIKTADPFTLLQEDVVHVRGLSSDGFTGLSPIAIHRESMGLALAAESHGANFFKNNAVPGWIIKPPGSMTKEARERLREDLRSRHAGSGNAFHAMIIPPNVDMAPITISNKDAQYIEARKFQIGEIARIFRVPPHMIGDLEKATFSNIEHQSIDFVVHTIRPWLVRWEQALWRDVLEPAGLGNTHFAEFNVDGLLRGDNQSRAAFYSQMFNIGVFSINDIRQSENLNSIGEDGDNRYRPLNMAPVGEDTLAEPEPLQPRSAEAFRVIVDEAADRIAHTQTLALERRAPKAREDRKRFDEWWTGYCETHRAYVTRTLAPLATAWSTAFGVECDAGAVAEHVVTATRQGVNGDDPMIVVGEWKLAGGSRLAPIIMDAMNMATTDESKVELCR